METGVLLHCSGSSGAQWRPLAAQPGSRGAAALRLEEPAHLVGHSYGGAVALHLARTRPQLVVKTEVPTLLVQGGDTKLPSRCVCARLRTALPEATFRVVQGADQINALIHNHLMEETCNRAMPSALKSPSACAGRSTAT